VTVTEGTGSTTMAAFTIQVAPPPKVGASLQVGWATAPGSATAPGDFTASSGTVTLTKSATTRVVSVPIVGDAIDEPDETFLVNLMALVGTPGRISDPQGVGTIVDDDAAPSLSINNVSVSEGNTGTTTATFTVSLFTVSAKTVTFDWATAAGTATAGTDYVTASGSRTIAAGATTATIPITVIGDTLDEGDETFTLNLSSPVNATIAGGSGTGTIIDDDALPTLSVNNVPVPEGNAGTTTATFTVSLSAASAKTVTFNWATVAGTATAGTDYVTASGIRTIAAGATTATIPITVKGDTLDELDETFTLNLSNPVNATIAGGSGTGTIIDDDPAPSLSIKDVSVLEGNAGNTAATFTVSLSAASAKTVTFNWATAAGTATAGIDYVTASGNSTIAPGATTATIAITVNGDTLDEFDETFTVGLSNPVNATISDGSGTGTITDDDAVPTLSVNDVQVTEGNAGATTATFTVSLSAPSAKTVSVNWASADDDAVQPIDYTAGSGTLTFVPEDTSETLAVSVNGDLVAELDEMFHVTLSSPTNATIGDGRGFGTIVDDELQPVIDIDEPTALEGTGTITFAVTLSHQSDLPVTVDWSTAAGTATNGADYLDTNSVVTFDPMETAKTVTITVNDDTTFERDETFALNLSNASGAPIGDAQGVGTIANDDDAPGLSVGDVSVAEGNTGQKMLTFSVSLSGATELDATADFTTAGITASAGTDYLETTGSLTIPAGETGATIDVVVNGDTTYESGETLSVALADPGNAALVDGTATGTIRNDDKASTTLTLRLTKAPKTLTAKGVMERAKAGLRVTATLYRKVNGSFVKVSTKTSLVRDVRDRDHDGKLDGSHTTTFVRPKTAGTYKVIVGFKGTATFKPSSRSTIFTLAAI
jgi:hypothetical protein